MTISLYSPPQCELHSIDAHHPESSQRLAAINDQIIRSGLDFVLVREESTKAPLEAVYRAHDKHYVDDLFDKVPSSGHRWLDPDTMITATTMTAALYAAGANINAVDKVMKQHGQQAFCAVRPPGHHATRQQAMGFCLLNNVAIAAYHALHHHGLERVAIVDFDVHHGNGTEDIVAGDSRILFCSSFQQQLYPFSDDNLTDDNILSTGLAPGTGSLEWRQSIYPHWFTALDNFKPQLILCSAGFDGHAEDDMSQFILVEDDYYWVTEHIKRIADKHCHGRIVSTLEGGYDLSALGRSVVAHLKAMLGSDSE